MVVLPAPAEPPPQSGRPSWQATESSGCAGPRPLPLVSKEKLLAYCPARVIHAEGIVLADGPGPQPACDPPEWADCVAMAAPRSSPLRVLIADDHQLILDGVRHALEATPDFEVVGEASNGTQVLALVKRVRADVVVLDIRMPGMDGLVCLDQIKKGHPDIKVIVLSASADQKLIENVLRRGASAYIVKSVNPIDLPSVIRQAVDETVYTAIGAADDSADAAAKSAGLTPRELAILTALAQGKSNAAIAKELWVAPQTVKFHLTNIYRKLQVANRTEAARYAYQQGLVESPLYADGDGELSG